jgi:hypothetical protein
MLVDGVEERPVFIANGRFDFCSPFRNFPVFKRRNANM